MNASDSYRIARRLGTGTSGAVYLAETAAGQTALRQFESPSEPDSEVSRRARRHFVDAGRQALGLNHPRIVPVVEVIEEGGEAFVASEFVASETLATAMAARRFSPEESGVLIREIAAALDYAHSRGVVHGDLKPADIFLLNGRPRIADFGISTRAHLDPLQPIPVHLAHRYLSPEHVRHPESVDAKSDQYSLAAIAYELYTGQSPYGAAASDLPGAILHAEILPPSQVAPGLPPRIDAPLLAALDRDPAKRFGSCKKFAGVLGAAFLDADTITEVRSRDSHGSRRTYLAVAGAVAVVALGALFLWPHKRADVAVHVSAFPPTVPAKPPGEKPPEPRPASTGKVRPIPSSGASVDASPKPSPVSSPPVGVPPASDKPKPFDPPVQKTVLPPQEAAPPVYVGLPDTPPPQQRPDWASPTPARRAARGFAIEVYSRQHSIKDGDSFSFSDPVLGELAHGDLRAIVTCDGQPAPRGRITLEWAVEGVSMDRKTVPLNRLVEYGNEPTAGNYLLTLYHDGRPVQTFKFGIKP